MNKRPMKVGLIGGIYGQGDYLRSTPETTLEYGLREAGHQVTTISHYDAVDFARLDIVHVHHLSYGAVRLASSSSQTPYVFTAHDLSQMNGAPLSVARRLAMQYVYTTADGVVSLSQREAEFQRKTYSITGARQMTIRNGRDSRIFQYRRNNTRGVGRPWQILFVGQLIPLKRCNVLFHALSRIGREFELSLVYQNPQMEDELRALAVTLQIASRVHFLGKKQPDELAEMYQSSDLLVLPSSTESLPSVLTEAMMCGLPFVASAVGGIPEQTAGFGTLLEVVDADSLRAAITKALDEYGALHADSERMSAYANETFSIGSMVRQHIALYSELCGKPPRRKRNSLSPVHAVTRMALRYSGKTSPHAVSQAALSEK
jgi:glycosyltransferase involved in cell wall biosynthesis